MRLFAVYFADQVRAEVVDITLSNTYEGMLGGRRSGGTGSLLEDLKERQEQIRNWSTMSGMNWISRRSLSGSSRR